VLKDLESKSIYIIREVKAKFRNPAVLWSTGKDSTCVLHLIKKAFFGKVPFPVIHIDTGMKFPEIYEFRDRIAKEWNLNLIVAKNEDALKKGVSPKTREKFECCHLLKTEALKTVIKKHGFDAIIVAIRRDEHSMRNVERFFSPRDENFKWHIVKPKDGDVPFESLQDAELSGWNIFASDFKDASHVRVHPILHWTEIDVWEYIKKNNVPCNPLYFSRNGKRYRSLGCMPCTKPVKSDAKTIDEIIEEIKTTKIEERSGRLQDKEREDVMRRLRALGYM